MNRLESLPEGLLGHIVSELLLPDMVRLFRASKIIYTLAFSNNLFISSGLERNWKMLIFADEEARNNPYFQQKVLARLKLNPDHPFPFSTIVSEYKAAMLFAKKGEYNSDFVATFMPHHWDDEELVRAGLSHRMLAFPFFKYVSPRLQGKKDIALLAVKQNYGNICFAPRHLQDDKEVALAAARKDGGTTGISLRLQRDMDVALAIVDFLNVRKKNFGYLDEYWKNAIPRFFRANQVFLRLLLERAPKLYEEREVLGLQFSLSTRFISWVKTQSEPFFALEEQETKS